MSKFKIRFTIVALIAFLSSSHPVLAGKSKWIFKGGKTGGTYASKTLGQAKITKVSGQFTEAARPIQSAKYTKFLKTKTKTDNIKVSPLFNSKVKNVPSMKINKVSTWKPLNNGNIKVNINVRSNHGGNKIKAYNKTFDQKGRTVGTGMKHIKSGNTIHQSKTYRQTIVSPISKPFSRQAKITPPPKVTPTPMKTITPTFSNAAKK
tara:strand:- start:3423 stop:4040 length:618 start_codon:yes stop_codon:yes gene_type:complete